MVFSIEILERDGGMEMRARRRLRMRNHLVHSAYWPRAAKVTAAFGEVLLASLCKGGTAARQIAVPALFVQALMGALAISYFYASAARGVFEQLVFIKNQVGLPFAFLTMGTIAVFAELLKRRFDHSSRSTPFWREAVYGFLVFGFLGIATDAFFLLQGNLWRELPTATRVPVKVLTDQFVYTVFFANPYQTLLYVWKDCGFKFGSFIDRLTPFKTFYAREMLAVLVTNWAFWIPTSAVLYSLPVDLQFVMAQLAIVIWVLLLNAVTRRPGS
ncbi:hypothetical protein BH09VER1_BH09VER1_47820 [soil metagenome]